MRRRSSSEHRRTTAMATSSSCHRAQDPNQSYKRMRLRTRPDRHVPRSCPNSHRQTNEQLTTSCTAHTGHGVVIVFWGEDVIATTTVLTAEATSFIGLRWTTCSSPITKIARTPEEAQELVQQNQGNLRDVQTVLVMKDYARGSIWAYPVAVKGIAATPHEVEMILHDFDACVLGSALMFRKTDQEPAIIECKRGSADYGTRSLPTPPRKTTREWATRRPTAALRGRSKNSRAACLP